MPPDLREGQGPPGVEARELLAQENVAFGLDMSDPLTGFFVVRRDVVRLVTPGTITEDNLLDSRSHNYLAAIARHEDMNGRIRRNSGIPVAICRPPEEVEAVLHEHPKVMEAAIIGVPHPKWQERPLACVVATPGESLSADELKDFLKDKVKADFWIPDEIIFLKEIPKTSVGKFDKRELRKLYANGQLKSL